MNSTKNIVLILGNGFDMNLGRHTSYKDFWNTEHCPKNYPSPLIRHLNGKWSENLEAVKWYDLENELLNFYRYRVKTGHYDFLDTSDQRFLRRWGGDEKQNILYYPQDQSTIKRLHENKVLIMDASGYLHPNTDYYEDLQLTAVDRDHKALELIKTGLCNFLKDVDGDVTSKHSVALSTLCSVNQARENGDAVSVYTFNYTALPCGYEDDLNPQYIHGRCKENNIIIGTKDSEEFNSDYDFLQKSFDPDFKTPPVVSDLLNADDVIIFGHSLGMNDSQYFKPFFSQQTNIQNSKRKRITIFTKDEKSKLEIKRSLQQMTDYNLSLLNSLNELEIITTDSISKNGCPFKSFIERYVTEKPLVRSLMTIG